MIRTTNGGSVFSFSGDPDGDSLGDCMDCMVSQLEDRAVLQALVNSLRKYGLVVQQQKIVDRLQQIVDSLDQG